MSLTVPPGTPSNVRQRRPSGAPPRLPRRIGATGKVWLGLAEAACLSLGFLPLDRLVLGERFEASVLARRRTSRRHGSPT